MAMSPAAIANPAPTAKSGRFEKKSNILKVIVSIFGNQ
jgi:hypothetical protein